MEGHCSHILLEDGYRPHKTNRGVFDLVGETRDLKAVRRQRFQIREFLHLSVANLPSSLCPSHIRELSPQDQ